MSYEYRYSFIENPNASTEKAHCRHTQNPTASLSKKHALLTHFTNYLTAARNLAPAGRNFLSSSVNYFVIKSKSTILLGMHGKFLIFNSEFAPSTIISLSGFLSLLQSPSLQDETPSCMVTRDPMKISPVQMNPNQNSSACIPRESIPRESIAVNCMDAVGRMQSIVWTRCRQNACPSVTGQFRAPPRMHSACPESIACPSADS